jgi:hypothetical protein
MVGGSDKDGTEDEEDVSDSKDPFTANSVDNQASTDSTEQSSNRGRRRDPLLLYVGHQSSFDVVAPETRESKGGRMSDPCNVALPERGRVKTLLTYSLGLLR